MSEFQHSYALIIGINDYKNGISALKTAVSDATEIARILETDHDYTVTLLLNQAATLSQLRQVLEIELPKQIQAGDRFLFYFAGHGIALNGEDGPEGYLVPENAKFGNVSNYLPMSEVNKALLQLPCRHFLGILDCCFAGAFRWSSLRKAIPVELVTIHKERYDRFIQDPAWQVLTSAACDQSAWDAFDLKDDRGQIGVHSPFACALIEALEGKADAFPPAEPGKPAGDGVITATDLYVYLRDRVEIATEARAIRQTPGIHCLNKHDKGEYIFLTPGHALNLPPAPPLDVSKNPYRGLLPFEEEDNKLFFGRNELIEKLQKLVQTNPLTVVLGASGCGKSSLVKAGLIPKLKKATTEQWCILSPIRPGETPLQALNHAVDALLPQIDLQNPQKTLSQSIAVWAKNHPDSHLLIFIDQSEEIITLCQDEDERKEFFQQILTAIDAHRDKLRVVLTLRSDFEPQVRDAGLKCFPTVLKKEVGNTDTELKKRWLNGRFIVPAMTRAELRQAIEKPAEARVMYFQPHDLVEQLINEVADMPGALPLLSFALSELYLKYLKRQRDAQNGGITIGRALTQEDYQALGGVIQSLTQRADEEYQALVQENPAYERVIRHVMLRMVALGGGELARRQVPLSELEYPPDKNSLVKKVIERFSTARLLVKGQDAEGNPYVEPAHDALVRGWERLLRWKQEEQESLLLQRRLTPAAMEWDSLKNKDKEQPKGILDKTGSVLDWLDRRFWFPIENNLNKIPAQLVRLLRRTQNQPERSREKPVQFLWNANPYLNVLDQELNSDDNWLNQVEAEFVQKSILQKRQNISWRWRIAGVVTSTISVAAIIAFIQFINAQKQLVSTIGALTNSSEELFESNKEFDALLASLNAGKQVKQVAIGVNPDTQLRVKVALQQAIYGVIEQNRLDGHKAEVYSVSYSPDGRLLASASGDATVKLWDVATGKEISNLTGHKDAVHIVSFSPDGRLLASASAADKTVKFWDIATGKEIFTFSGYEADGNGNKGVSFSPDGRLLAFASVRNTIQLWDVATRQQITTLIGHNNKVNGVSFSPDGRLLASASFDGTVKLWDVATGKEISTLTGHNTWVFGVSFSPDGRRLASGADGGSIKLWDVATRKEITNLSGLGGRVTNLSFSPNGQLLVASGFNNAVKLWDVATGKEISTLTGHRANVNSVSFSPDGKQMASASSDHSIKLWYIAQRKEINTLFGHNNKVNGVSFSPDGRLLASASFDGTVKLWDVTTGKEISTLRGHQHWINSVSFSPDGKHLASGSWDNTVKLWDVATGKEISTLIGHKLWVMSVSFSPDGQQLASASWDSTVKLWDVATGKEIATLIGHKDTVMSVSFSPDGRLLASGSGDKTIKLWDVATGKELATLTGHKFGVNSVSFSPDGRLLASATDRTIKLWDVAARKEIATLAGHRVGVNSVGFSSDGRLLASASNDRSIILWDVATRKEINIFNARTEVNSISFSQDGQLLASGNRSGTVILWNLEILSKLTLDDLMARGCDRVRNYLQNNPNVTESDRHLCDDVKK